MTDIAQGEPKVRRWTGQRWALDNVLRSVGIDWDQPRSFYLNAACGIEGGADFAAIRERVKKYADVEPAFANTARRREAKARAAEEDGSPITARDNYFMAAIHWGSAQWSHYDNDATNLAYNKSKRDCYTNYARLADHRIEPVMIPFKGKTLPGWFHLPPNYTGGRIPVVISFPGMDTYKEVFVALKGDRWLERGIAVLALDGPGQAECRVLGIDCEHGELDSGRQSRGRLARGAARDRSAEDRRLRQQLRLVFRHSRHRERAAHLRLRRQLQQP